MIDSVVDNMLMLDGKVNDEFYLGGDVFSRKSPKVSAGPVSRQERARLLQEVTEIRALRYSFSEK